MFDALEPGRGVGVIEAESNGSMGVQWNIYATEKVRCNRLCVSWEDALPLRCFEDRLEPCLPPARFRPCVSAHG